MVDMLPEFLLANKLYGAFFSGFISGVATGYFFKAYFQNKTVSSKKLTCMAKGEKIPVEVIFKGFKAHTVLCPYRSSHNHCKIYGKKSPLLKEL